MLMPGQLGIDFQQHKCKLEMRDTESLCVAVNWSNENERLYAVSQTATMSQRSATRPRVSSSVHANLYDAIAATLVVDTW